MPMIDGPAPVSLMDSLMAHAARQIENTEIAINHWGCRANAPAVPSCNLTRAMQDAYMRDVLPLLDASPAVYRYAWYSARDQPQLWSTGNGGGNLLEWNISKPTLTSTGEMYSANVNQISAQVI